MDITLAKAMPSIEDTSWVRKENKDLEGAPPNGHFMHETKLWFLLPIGLCDLYSE